MKAYLITYGKWLLLALILIFFGFVMLRDFGGSFIQEIVQEVNIGQEETTARAAIGKKAPHFELLDLNGDRIKLSDFFGEPFILTFWTTWSEPSGNQIRIFDEYLAGHGETLFRVVTVSNQEDKNAVSNFMKRGNYKVRVLLDENGQVGERFEAKTLPVTYFFDRQGIIRDVFVGVLSGKMLVERAESALR